MEYCSCCGIELNQLPLNQGTVIRRRDANVDTSLVQGGGAVDKGALILPQKELAIYRNACKGIEGVELGVTATHEYYGGRLTVDYDGSGCSSTRDTNGEWKAGSCLTQIGPPYILVRAWISSMLYAIKGPPVD